MERKTPLRNGSPLERLIQGYSKRALGSIISWHSLRTTYGSRSVELEQSLAVVMLNTGDSGHDLEKLREAAGGRDVPVRRKRAGHSH